MVLTLEYLIEKFLCACFSRFIWGINTVKILMIISINSEREAMPRLSREQREQAIGQLYAGKAARDTANVLNCIIGTIERLRQRYNATNRTNDRPRSGRP